MDRAQLDVARLAAALIVSGGGRHATQGRVAAYAEARDLYAALEDTEVSELSLAMAIHGARCSGTRAGGFHEWSSHRPEAEELYEALSDPGLDDRLASRASEEDARGS